MQNNGLEGGEKKDENVQVTDIGAFYRAWKITRGKFDKFIRELVSLLSRIQDRNSFVRIIFLFSGERKEEKEETWSHLICQRVLAINGLVIAR